MRKLTLWWWVGVALIALALKRHYSVASAAELGWILRPVALLLQAITAQPLGLASTGTWRSEALGIELVKACAGVNFMILSFVGWCWSLRPAVETRFSKLTCVERPLLWAAAFFLAYGCAVLINVLRILLALFVGPVLDEVLAPGLAHRLIGLAVYWPALALQLTSAERRSRRRQALRIAALLYVALMIVTPLLTGEAVRRPALFCDHALIVAALCGLTLWLTRIAPSLLQWRHESGSNRARGPCASEGLEAGRTARGVGAHHGQSS